MKNKIREHIKNPEELENLFRSDKKGFENAFNEIHSEIAGHPISEFWKIRLNHEQLNDDAMNIGIRDLWFLFIACATAGLFIKLPQVLDFDAGNYFYYEKNAGLIVFLGLSVYAFLIHTSYNTRHILITALAFFVAAVYINLLPSNSESHSVLLAYIHLPLMIWCLYGLVFTGFDIKNKSAWIDFIKYNGDLVVLLAIIAIAGGALTGLTIGLFSAIGLVIEKFYFENIVMVGMVSAPVVATFITRKYSYVIHKIAPIIANIFSPLVLITLIAFLITFVLTGKDPYNDRDFLLVFNLMLFAVIGIIVFSISEASKNKRQRFNEWTLFALSVLAVVVDLIALSAITYRLGEFGFTPNRTVILGSNILVFVNLVVIMVDLYKVNFKNKELKLLEMTVANYLPIYALWTIFVVFALPLIFSFK